MPMSAKVALSTGSAVVTRVATGAAASVLATNANRKAVTFKNVAAEPVYIAETSGKATAAAGIRLNQNETLKFDRSTNEWFAFSAVAGDLAIVQEV